MVRCDEGLHSPIERGEEMFYFTFLGSEESTRITNMSGLRFNNFTLLQVAQDNKRVCVFLCVSPVVVG